MKFKKYYFFNPLKKNLIKYFRKSQAHFDFFFNFFLANFVFGN